jgi:DNA-binding PadR family transcriptional regulator
MSDSPSDLLPLHKDTFHILVALAGHDRHGYSIMQDIAARTDGQIKLSPSTLYSAVKRMLEGGLIEELDERPDPEEDDERRRYYRITKWGRKVAMAEARRLERLLADARATGLVPRKL